MDKAEGTVEIQWPPYPTQACSPVRLHALLVRLADWVEFYRPVVLRHFGKDRLKPARLVPGLDFHLSMPLPRLVCVFNHAIKVREWWDTLVRNHEECWGSSRCLENLAHIVQSAQECLENAYLPEEQLEARMADKARHSAVDHFLKHVVRFNPEDGSIVEDGDEDNPFHADPGADPGPG